MRLGILTQYYPPEMGAPQARLSELARAFVASGHQVEVLTAMPNYPRGVIQDGYGGFYRRETIDGVNVQRAFIYPTKSLRTTVRLANYFSFVGSSALVGSFKLPKLDYLITESPPLFLGLSGFLLSRWKRSRWIFNVSDLWPESAVRMGVVGPGWSLSAAERLESFCYRKAWLVSGQSQEILEDVHRRFPKIPTYHLSNGVDSSYFRPDRANLETRRMLLGESQASSVAVYAGLHGLAQGLDQILAAATRLRELDWLVVFIGDGPEKTKLRTKAVELGLTEDRVRFLDPMPRERIADCLASADLALVPLGFHLPGAVPSKLYEAMGAGRAVMLVAEGEAVSILEHHDAGFSARPGDLETLTSKLQQLLLDPTLRERLGRNGREAAVSRYDRGLISKSFINHLEEHLGG